MGEINLLHTGCNGYFPVFPEKLVNDFVRTLTSILDEHPTVRVIVQRPMYRLSPSQYKLDLAVMTVSS
jgi:hypothetical protein